MTRANGLEFPGELTPKAVDELMDNAGILPLTRNRVPGDAVYWHTISSGERHEGTLAEWDNWTAIITLGDGKEKAVQC